MEVAITNTQQGVITEAEFAKIAILTSNGRLVPTRALADDDRRDFEIHIRRHFRESLAVQLKTAKHLRLHGRSRVLQINFRVKAPLVSDEHLYYFLAHFRRQGDGLHGSGVSHSLAVLSQARVSWGQPRHHPAAVQSKHGAQRQGYVDAVRIAASGAGCPHPRDPEVRLLRSTGADSDRGRAHRLAGHRLATSTGVGYSSEA